MSFGGSILCSFSTAINSDCIRSVKYNLKYSHHRQVFSLKFDLYDSHKESLDLV
jgi:hypothetical protein